MAEVVRIVIRLIRSCEYKNIRNIVLREDIDGFELSTTTVKDLMKIILQKLSSGKINPPLPPPFKNFNIGNFSKDQNFPNCLKREIQK